MTDLLGTDDIIMGTILILLSLYGLSWFSDMIPNCVVHTENILRRSIITLYSIKLKAFHQYSCTRM